MRKFSRILSTLLAACILICAMVVAVSAAVPPAPTIPDGATGGITSVNSSALNATGNAYKADYNCYVVDGLLLTNGTHDGPSHGSTCTTGGYVSDQSSFVNGMLFSYLTYDFDFCATGYYDDRGYCDNNATSGKLSYTEGMYLTINNTSGATKSLNFVLNGNNWYLSIDKTYDEADVALATEKNVYNHLTVVDTGEKFWIFLDGKFVAEYSATFKGSQRCRIGFVTEGAKPADISNYSIAMANLVHSRYSEDYASGEAFGLDDYIAVGDFTVPLYNCEDVVYSKNYTYNNPVDAQFAAIINTVAGDSAKHLFIDVAIDAINSMKATELDYAKITITKSILDWTPTKDLKSVTFVAKRGAEVTLSQEAKDIGYTVTSSDNGDGSVKYVVKMAESANLVFMDDSGNIIATKQSPIGVNLKTLNVKVPVTYNKNNSKYKILDHWEMRDGNGNWFEFYGDDTKLESDYVFFATDSYTPGVKSIVVKAFYKEVPLAFAVLTKDANSLVITEDIKKEMYTDSANIAACVNAAEEEVTLVLHKDAMIAASDSIVVKANATLNVDLNGNTLSQNDGTMFIVNDGATLNLTSSDVGAELVQTQTATEAATVLIAGADDAKSYNINIVNSEEKEISVYAGTIVDIKGGEYNGKEEEPVFTNPADSSATDDKPVVINIIGGNYYALMPLSNAMFNVRSTEVQLNITNANLYNMDNGAIFSANAEENVYFAEANITVTDSLLYTQGYSNATVFNVWTDDCAATISHSSIVGNVFSSNIKGSVSVGAYTYIQLGTNAIKYTEFALADDLTLLEDCIPVRANLKETITLNYPSAEEYDVYYGIVVLDETDAEAMANIVTVTWLDPNGDVYAVEEWFKGSFAVGYDTTEFGVLTDTKNGWYTRGYASWEDENAKDIKYGDYILDEDVTFRPVMGLVASVAVKVNMSLLTKFEANIYIPLATPENVRIVGLYTHYNAYYGVNDLYHVDENIREEEAALIDGMSYSKHSFFFDNSDVDKTVTRYLAIEVDGKVMVQTITVDLLGYAETVMEQYGCSSEEAVLVYNLINYAHEAYKFKNDGAEYAAATEFLALEDHDTETCECYFGYDYDLDEVSLDYKEGLGENVYGVSYDISDEMPAFIVYAKTDAKTGAPLISEVKVQFYGINYSLNDTMYEYNITLVRGEDVVIEGKTYATFTFESMPLYNAAEVMSITVTNAEDGSEVSGTYSLATYIDHFICYPADDSGLDVAKALYSFAKVANDYKNLAD